MAAAWMSKYDLARHFGLYDGDGNPRVSGIERNVASGLWPAHKVLGENRFSPEDVAEIEQMLIHPATARRRATPELPPEPPASEPLPREKTTRRKNTSAKTSNGWDLTPIPLSPCRGKSA